jgi:hypothetical protein
MGDGRSSAAAWCRVSTIVTVLLTVARCSQAPRRLRIWAACRILDRLT